MASIIEKSAERPRALLFGLLVNCVFSTGAEEDCPLLEMRNNLSLEEKYKYVMGLTIEEIKNILLLHEECYDRRF
jgi:hypothetical protein